MFVDADACPVKDEVFRVADRHRLRVYLVSNQWLAPQGGPRVEQVVVSREPDAADDWIAERIERGDIAITADIPLAARCLDKGARALGPDGKPFTEEGIGTALAMRDLNAQLRESGEIKGYNAAFRDRDRSRFLQALEQAVQARLREG